MNKLELNKKLDLPMDHWIKRKIGLTEETALTRANLEQYQLEKLIETLWMAKKNSLFL